jgi:hypothetical protein
VILLQVENSWTLAQQALLVQPGQMFRVTLVNVVLAEVTVVVFDVVGVAIAAEVVVSAATVVKAFAVVTVRLVAPTVDVWIIPKLFANYDEQGMAKNLHHTCSSAMT